MNADNRQRIISRRVLTPKGETEGGGGGADAGAGTLRKDFRVLAFWLGSVTTDEYGKGSIEVKLPESLTTYRIMAVAADRSSRFGSSDAEVRINKPLTLKPTFPRFLALGDKALLRGGRDESVEDRRRGDGHDREPRSRRPRVHGRRRSRRCKWPPAASIEARFDAAGKRVGRARVRMTVKLGDETDAFEDVIPVELLVSAGDGRRVWRGDRRAARLATETLTIPASVVPGLGGLHVELSSTAMVGLGEGARYLVEYPYGCAEQRGSRTLALVLAADLGDAFSLPGMDTAKMRPAAQQNLKDLEKFQCPNGGFCVLAGRLPTSRRRTSRRTCCTCSRPPPTRSSRSIAACARGPTPTSSSALAAEPPTNEGWWPAYTAWQAFAVKVLVEGGRNQDSNLDAALRLSRADAGVRARLSPRRDGRARRDVSRLDRPHRRPPAPHGQRHPARSGQRARRGAERSVPALVLELQRPLHVDRAQLAREGRRQRRAGPADGALDDGGAQGRTLGQHAGERAARWKRSSPTTGSTRARRPTSARWSRSAPRSSPREEFRGRSTTSRTKELPMSQGARAGAGRHVAAADVHARRHRHALLHRAPALRGGRALPGRASTTASASRARYAPVRRERARGRPRPATRPAIWCA